MINLKTALNCLEAIKQRGGDPSRYKIGIVKEDITSFSCYKKGTVVLYHPDAHFAGDKNKTVCIETPMSQEWLDKTLAKGSHICTVGTMVGVPPSLIEEVVI